MSYQSNTLTRTNEITHTDVRKVVWKIKSDMYQLRIFHDVFDMEYEENMSFDLYQWTYRGFADKIQFQFYIPTSYVAKFVISYAIIRGQVVGTNDDAGTIPYLNLKGTRFRVEVTPSQKWKDLPAADKEAFYDGLKRNWGSSSFDLQYNTGSWAHDKTYSSNCFGAMRSIYKA